VEDFCEHSNEPAGSMRDGVAISFSRLCSMESGICVITQYINISIDQKLMYFIKFQSLLILLDLQDAIF